MRKTLKIRVLIVDDHAILRAGLRMLVNSQPDLEVIGEAADGQEALARAREVCPDVVTMDLSMPGLGAMRAVKQLWQLCPEARVLVLTMFTDPAYMSEALAVGCSGFVVKAAADTELLTGIRAVHEGRTFIVLQQDQKPSLAASAFGETSPVSKADDVLSKLSTREREVFALLARGHSNQAIADRLYLSVKTIETYRARLVRKLKARGRAELVRLAIDAGLFDLTPSPPGEAPQPLP